MDQAPRAVINFKYNIVHVDGHDYSICNNEDMEMHIKFMSDLQDSVESLWDYTSWQAQALRVTLNESDRRASILENTASTLLKVLDSLEDIGRNLTHITPRDFDILMNGFGDIERLINQTIRDNEHF